jgi:hypothetical protein
MSEWYETLEAPLLEHVTAKGWNKPAADVISAAAMAHYEAQKLIGAPADQVLRMPKDASDPTYATVYDRIVSLSAPKSADEYKFDDVKFRDGAAFEPEDAAWLREYATANKLTVQATRDLASRMVARTEAGLDGAAAQETAAKTANAAALQAAWSTQHDTNLVASTNATEGLKALGIPVEKLFDGLPPDAYVAAQNGLVKLANQLREATFHGGGNAPPRNDFAGMTPQDARAKFVELSANREWGAKALQIGTQEATYLANLQRIMVGQPAQ